MDFKEIKERLAKLDTACLCDCGKKLRIMDPEIRPIIQGVKMIGKAHTVHCKADFLTVLKALHDAQEGEVIVIDGEGEKIALAGEMFALESRKKKLGGIVVDGGCRDVNGIREIKSPLFARYITPAAGTSSKIFKTQVQVNCGGVPVSPGDIVFGDDDGIIVMTEKEVSEILDTAENIQRIEAKAIRKMGEGKNLTDVLNFFDHYAKISKKEDSRLIFTV
jgi:4-hydroxy-4-methyl-2-oxoglutarate aldolase